MRKKTETIETVNDTIEETKAKTGETAVAAAMPADGGSAAVSAANAAAAVKAGADEVALAVETVAKKAAAAEINDDVSVALIVAV